MTSETAPRKNVRLIGILSLATMLLLLPLIAMQFDNNGVNWSGTDFVIAGILLYGTGLLCEFVIRRTRNTTQRIMICGAILLALFIVWAELAVGIFGSPIAGS